MISVAHEAGNLDDLRAVLGNDVAVAAYRDNKLPFPNGAIIARLAWSYLPSEENNKVFGREQSFVAGAPTNVQFMVKDATKYASTGGWGFAQYKDGKPDAEAALNACFPCNVPVKARDYVFTRYAPSPYNAVGRVPEKVVADSIKVFLLVISALFPIVDPLAGSPIFLAMTQEYPDEIRNALAWRVALNSLLLMVGSYFIGSHVLNFFGVSLPVVQVGGGLVVASVGWGMLLEKEPNEVRGRKDVRVTDALHSAFYPLTLPLTVGPGSISVAITLGANSTRRYGFHIMIVIAAVMAMAAVAISVWLCYRLAEPLGRMLGTTGMTVIVRLSSFLLVCIGVQIMWNGISSLLLSLHR